MDRAVALVWRHSRIVRVTAEPDLMPFRDRYHFSQEVSNPFPIGRSALTGPLSMGGSITFAFWKTNVL